LGALGTGTPRALILYGRSRGIVLSLAGVIVVCSLFWWLRDWGERGELRQAGLVQAIPALIASMIGMSVWSPFGEPERTGARSLPQIWVAHLAVVVLPALVLSALAVSAWRQLSPDADLVDVVVRNIIWLTGVSLLCGRVIDARLTWIGPLMWLAFSLIGTMLLSLEGGKGFTLWDPPWWAWMARSDASGSAWAIALALGLAGAILICQFGPRDASGEEE
ncbi:MAG: hypothetical protein M3440_06110, partial [Chloroflexota bacterium]|nr:hypothetical protein [Chloroflexota bacterium]